MSKFSIVRMFIALGLAVIASLGLGLSAAAAQETPQTAEVTLDQVYSIARHLYCPVCPNETLDSCRTQACAEWRDEIRRQLEDGATEAQIVANFVARYGERVVGTPQDQTLHALSVYTPYVLAAAAAVIGFITLSRWRSQARRSAQMTDTPTAPIDDEYRARIERDLRG